MRVRRPALIVLLAASTSVVVSACGGSAALPPATTVIDVTMTEYHFTFRSSVPMGRVVFRVFNAGHRAHSLTLERLPSDFPPIDVQLHAKTRRGAPSVAIMPTLRPGARSTFSAELVRGRYALVSFAKGQDGVLDALKGMNGEIRVRRR